MEHVHQYTVMRGDGLGWRCGECDALKDQPKPGHVWKAAAPKDEHQHEFDFVDKDGWHCRTCGAIKDPGT